MILAQLCLCVSPLAHDLVRIRQITAGVLHLRRVGIADFVISSTIICTLNHDDVRAGTAQLDWVTFTRQLPPNNCHGHRSTTEGCKK